MIISRLDTDTYTYFNLHAEEVITSNFIQDNNIGMSGDRLQIETIDRLIEYVKAEVGTKSLVLDFKYLNACQPNLNKRLFHLKKSGYSLTLTNISQALTEELSLASIENSNSVLDNGIFKIFYFFENLENIIPLTDIKIHLIFEKEFLARIKKHVSSYTEPHTSSFVYLTSYVDMKKFISHEHSFLLFSLYRLANKIRIEWQEYLEEDPVLICLSLNSSFLVSILSNFLKLDILIFDKIGPINKLYNRLDNNISDKRKYIIVSDLVCLGTEVKIVKNLIQFIGGQCLGNVSLIKTETLRKSDIEKHNATMAVFSIKKSNNKELNYFINTNLDS